MIHVQACYEIDVGHRNTYYGELQRRFLPVHGLSGFAPLLTYAWHSVHRQGACVGDGQQVCLGLRANLWRRRLQHGVSG